MSASIVDQFRLNGRVALVTGGVRGLGRAMADGLASAGATVVLTARQEETARTAAEAIASTFGVQTLGLKLDVTEADAVAEAVRVIAERFSRLDILVNNAGINIRGVIEELSEEDWEEVIDTNLKGPWLCCRAVAPLMKSQRWGRVINVSSMLGAVSLAGRTPYASSKGGLTMLTRTLALEWAPYGITVNALCPGPFITEINAPLLQDPQLRASFESRIPLGRWGEPKELQGATLFLASEASSFMTGAELFVDGGYTAQ